MLRGAPLGDTIRPMRKRWVLFIGVPCVALFLGGCTQSLTFQVAVRNETSKPITVGFTKEGGGPFEPQWATPEQIAIQSPDHPEAKWDCVEVPPGKTGVAGPITGNFDSHAVALLRVYGATGPMEDLMAISRGSPARVDVPLSPGRNAIIIRDAGGGRLAAEHVQLPPPEK
jgi:hypothetical protein